MYLSTPTPSVLLQKPVKIFSQESVWKGEWDRFHSSLQGWSVAGEYDDHYYRIITTRSHDGTFTPAEEMAEVIMRFGKVTRLLAMIAPAWKTQWPVAVLYACGLIGMQLCRFSGLHFQQHRDKSRQKNAPFSVSELQMEELAADSCFTCMWGSCTPSGSDLCST